MAGAPQPGAVTAPRQIKDNLPVLKRKFTRAKVKKLARKL